MFCPIRLFSEESSSERREAVKKKTAEYLMRAEQISSHFLKSSMGQGSTQTVVRWNRKPHDAFYLCKISQKYTLLKMSEL